jgi:hypothetical protein
VGTKACRVRPRAVWRHFKGFGEPASPFGDCGGFAPVIGDSDGPSLSKFADRNVAVQTPVAVVAGPLDDHDPAVEMEPPSDFEGQAVEVRLDLGNQLGTVYSLSQLRPLAHRIVR